MTISIPLSGLAKVAIKAAKAAPVAAAKGTLAVAKHTFSVGVRVADRLAHFSGLKKMWGAFVLSARNPSVAIFWGLLCVGAFAFGAVHEDVRLYKVVKARTAQLYGCYMTSAKQRQECAAAQASDKPAQQTVAPVQQTAPAAQPATPDQRSLAPPKKAKHRVKASGDAEKW